MLCCIRWLLHKQEFKMPRDTLCSLITSIIWTFLQRILYVLMIKLSRVRLVFNSMELRCLMDRYLLTGKHYSICFVFLVRRRWLITVICESFNQVTVVDNKGFLFNINHSVPLLVVYKTFLTKVLGELLIENTDIYM